MPLLSKDSKFFYFIHIPKTGGTSIENAARKGGWRVQMLVSGHSHRDMPFLPVTPQHFHGEILDKIFNFSEGLSVFTIVRHPFHRFKSEYYWQTRQGLTNLYASSWISSAMGSCKLNKSVYDNHLRPQIDFLPKNISTTVFKLEEDGIEDALRLLHIKGMPTWRKLINKTSREKISKKSIYTQDIEEQFEIERRAIEAFYLDDMKEFGYERTQ